MLKTFTIFISSRIAAGLALLLVAGLSGLWVWPSRGLLGEYYENSLWQGEPAFSQRDKTIGLRDLHQHHPTFPQKEFSIRWSGWIRIDREGEYTFSLLSDDGSSLFIDTTFLIDNGGFHPFRKRSESIVLSKGLHSFQVNYFQGAADYGFKIYWAPPGKPEAPLPSQVLYPEPFPVRGIGFLTRHLAVFYPVSWLLLLATLVIRIAVRSTENTRYALKRLAQNIALAGVTLVVALLILEGVFRIGFLLTENHQDPQALLRESQKTAFTGKSRTYSLKGMVQPSPYHDIVYELKPHLHGVFLGAPVVTNSQGLRDREYPYQKPANTVRIVGLGDSSMFGWGVAMEETMLKVLERTLNEQSASRHYEVLNFAVPGYNTAIETEVFAQKCLNYDPDLVIMHFNTNDYDVPYFMQPPRSYTTLRKSYLGDFLYSRYQQLINAQPEEVIPFVIDTGMHGHDPVNLDKHPDFPDEYRHMVGETGFIRALERLVQETRSRGIDLVVYVVKSYPGLDPAYTPNEFRTRQLELITRLSEEMGFYLLNMYPFYMTYRRNHPEAGKTVFWLDKNDTHPSVIAHQIEAEAVYNFLVAHELVDITEDGHQF